MFCKPLLILFVLNAVQLILLPMSDVQVSTGTGIMSHFVNLHIVVPEAFILGSGEHHVDVGSVISLVCMIDKVTLSNPLTVATSLVIKHVIRMPLYFYVGL